MTARQYLVRGPLFGGMSGVVYGLLGLLWMYKKFNSSFEYVLPKNDVWMMIGWFVLCLFGVFGPIANMAHALGLSVGMLWGIVYGSIKAKKRPSSLMALKFISFSLLATFLTTLIEMKFR